MRKFLAQEEKIDSTLKDAFDKVFYINKIPSYKINQQHNNSISDLDVSLKSKFNNNNNNNSALNKSNSNDTTESHKDYFKFPWSIDIRKLIMN